MTSNTTASQWRIRETHFPKPRIIPRFSAPILQTNDTSYTSPDTEMAHRPYNDTAPPPQVSNLLPGNPRLKRKRALPPVPGFSVSAAEIVSFFAARGKMEIAYPLHWTMQQCIDAATANRIAVTPSSMQHKIAEPGDWDDEVGQGRPMKEVKKRYLVVTIPPTMKKRKRDDEEDGVMIRRRPAADNRRRCLVAYRPLSREERAKERSTHEEKVAQSLGQRGSERRITVKMHIDAGIKELLYAFQALVDQLPAFAWLFATITTFNPNAMDWQPSPKPSNPKVEALRAAQKRDAEAKANRMALDQADDSDLEANPKDINMHFGPSRSGPT